MPTCISKSQLAADMGVSPSTLRRYLKTIESQLPYYHAEQKVLTPAQYAVFRDHYCLID